MYHFYMKKFPILVAVFSLTIVGGVLAQSATDNEEIKKDHQETVKKEDKATKAVKAVPAARNQHSKPEKVTTTKPRNARPGGTRPARNVRPSSRPVRPGNGRN
jgi:hypothetical protein